MIRVTGKGVEQIVGLKEWADRVTVSECENKQVAWSVVVSLLWMVTQD